MPCEGALHLVEVMSDAVWFDVRDNISTILNCRGTDLKIGYTLSFWKATEKAIPRALKVPAEWDTLVSTAKKWLEGDKKRYKTVWDVRIVDLGDTTRLETGVKAKGGKKVRIFAAKIIKTNRY